MNSKLLQNKRRQGFTLTEVVLGAVILSVSMAASTQLWNSTQSGMSRSSLRIKIDSAMSRRMDEIRHCARFYEIDTSVLKNPLEVDCRLLRIDRTANPFYTKSTLCSDSTLGTGLKSYLSSNSPNLIPSEFNLMDYDSSAASIPITVKTEPDGNRLVVTMEVDSKSNSLSVQRETSITPYLQAWCEYSS